MNRRGLLRRAVLFAAGMLGLSTRETQSSQTVKRFEFGKNIEVKQIYTFNTDGDTKRYNTHFPNSNKRKLVILQKDYMKTLYPQIDRLNQTDWVESAILYLDQYGYGMLVGFGGELSLCFASKPFTKSFKIS